MSILVDDMETWGYGFKYWSTGESLTNHISTIYFLCQTQNYVKIYALYIQNIQSIYLNTFGLLKPNHNSISTYWFKTIFINNVYWFFQYIFANYSSTIRYTLFSFNARLSKFVPILGIDLDDKDIINIIINIIHNVLTLSN